jgi:pyruvate,water dikinase
MIVLFPDEHKLPSISQVGGKGFRLVNMALQGFNVPSGFILTTDFFKPWFTQLQQTQLWQVFVDNLENSSKLQNICDELKTLTSVYTLNEEQRVSLENCLQQFKETVLFAVRSSSPEEDLGIASFAGVYETVLGVNKNSLLEAIRYTFASCLDHRIVIYKAKKNYDLLKPNIAIVIQKQIRSDSAGVAFSLNPLNNDYDELLINSNFGLGESVVSGAVSPDSIIINKQSNRIVCKSLGAKELSLQINKEGGTTEVKHEQASQFSITDSQALIIMEEVQKIEAYYHQPMDVEWAIEDEHIYLLQTRPITAYNVLPQKLLTKPSEKRRIYFDITLSVQGFHKPLSPLSSDVFAYVINAATVEVAGKKMVDDVSKALPFSASGRLYLNLSNVLSLLPSDKIIQCIQCMDGLAASALEEAKLDEFRNSSFKKIGLICSTLIRSFPRIKTYYAALNDPKKARQKVDRACRDFQNRVKTMNSDSKTMDKFVKQVTDQSAVLILQITEPSFVATKIAMSKIRKLFPNANKEQSQMIDRLDQSLPGNITVAMGHDLFLLSRQLNSSFSVSSEELYKALQQGKLGNNFHKNWNDFINCYGHRCVEEIELSQQRFRDNPRLLLDQLQEYRKIINVEESPLTLYAAAQDRRKANIKKLEQVLNPGQKKKLHHLLDVVVNLGGLREAHKYNVVFGLDVLRSEFLKISKIWVEEKRLDQQQDIFDLRLIDIQKGRDDRSLDLRKILNKNRAYFQTLTLSKQQFPVFDSRGRFYKPKVITAKNGEIVGQPISSGIVTGKVKILYSADEKPLLAGEILVARATDPGWTPLFVNAAAIILEVGGPLQHGALIAREYGKPCVGGLLGVTELFKDGDLVTVDGGSGLVKKEK